MAAPNLFLVSLSLAVLFFLLTPGVLLTLPQHSDKETVAFTHAFVFTIIAFFIHFFAFGVYPHVLVTIVTFFLFYLLTPGILLRIPPHGNKSEVAVVHAIVFAIVEAIVVRGILAGSGVIKAPRV
jgi:hypothetical protein